MLSPCRSARARYKLDRGVRGSEWWSDQLDHERELSRTLSGGLGIANGANLRRTIFLELVDQTLGNKFLGVWTHVNNSIICSGLVYRIGLQQVR